MRLGTSSLLLLLSGLLSVQDLGPEATSVINRHCLCAAFLFHTTVGTVHLRVCSLQDWGLEAAVSPVQHSLRAATLHQASFGDLELGTCSLEPACVQQALRHPLHPSLSPFFLRLKSAQLSKAVLRTYVGRLIDRPSSHPALQSVADLWILMGVALT